MFNVGSALGGEVQGKICGSDWFAKESVATFGEFNGVVLFRMDGWGVVENLIIVS